MSQQTKNFIDIIIKSGALIGLGIIGFFASRFVANTEVTRESVIRMEVQFNDHIENTEKEFGRIQNKLHDMEAEIKAQKRH